VKMHGDELDDLRFMLNLDAAGGEGKKGVIFNDCPELKPLVKGWAEELMTTRGIKQLKLTTFKI